MNAQQLDEAIQEARNLLDRLASPLSLEDAIELYSAVANEFADFARSLEEDQRRIEE